MEDIIVAQGHTTATVIHLMRYQKRSTNSNILESNNMPRIQCFGVPIFYFEEQFQCHQIKKKISYFLTLPFALQRVKKINILLLHCQGKE